MLDIVQITNAINNALPHDECLDTIDLNDLKEEWFDWLDAEIKDNGNCL